MVFSSSVDRNQFIYGLVFGLLCSISVSLWKWNQTQEFCGKSVAEKMKKKRKSSEMKMVIVVRKDLKLTKRELLTQGVYACIEAFKESVVINPSCVKRWQRFGEPKIAVKVNDENELLMIQSSANNRNLVNCLVRDADPSKNNALILCIGPDTVEEINLITGHLKLY